MTKYATTQATGLQDITPGKLYAFFNEYGGWFSFFDDAGDLRTSRWGSTYTCVERVEGKAEQIKAAIDAPAPEPKTFGEWALLPIPMDIMPEDAFRVEYLYDEGGNPVAYRRKPDPVVREVALTGKVAQKWIFTDTEAYDTDTYRITFTTTDGKPDLDSIKMEEIEESNT